MYYSEDIIAQVRERNPVVDVIGSYVHLTKKGGNYFGLCPFHNEKSGSFAVSPSRNSYHCFGCGKGGNVITFIMEYENYSFPEALELLANRAGIELPKQEFTQEQKAEQNLRQRLLSMHKDAAIFYVHQLRSEEGKIGLAYFNRRQLKPETMQNFGLGYSPQRIDALYQYLRKQGYSDNELKASGLVTFTERGVRDKFWNRVMFPIMDTNNRVIAFGGRVMGDGEPKYLNSPETMLFDKSRNLYGLNVARKTKENFLLCCEGYMDVISLHQAGFTNAVASLGTAFTAQHGMIMKRYTKEVILCYDSDGAGKKAAMRAIPILRTSGLKMRVLDMSPYKDPDEFIKNLGAEAFRQRINEAKNAFLFEMLTTKESYDFSDPDDKTNFFKEAARRLAQFTDEIERNAYIEMVSNYFGIDYNVLKKSVEAIGNRQALTEETDDDWKPKSTLQKGARKTDGVTEAEKMILTTLVDSPEYYEIIKDRLAPADFKDGLSRDVATCLFEQLKKGKNAVSEGAILDRFIQTEQYNEVSELFSSTFGGEMNTNEKKEALLAAVNRVLEDSLDRQINEAVDPKVLMDLLKKKQELKKGR